MKNTGFKTNRGDFWMGLERVYKFTRAYSTSTYQLVMSAKRESDGKWMQIVYDGFYLHNQHPLYNWYLSGSIVEKHETSMSDSHARYDNNCYFGTYDQSQHGSTYSNYASSARGGWWWCRSPANMYICLNCDQRQTHLWKENGQKIRLTETQMSIRVKM